MLDLLILNLTIPYATVSINHPASMYTVSLFTCNLAALIKNSKICLSNIEFEKILIISL